MNSITELLGLEDVDISITDIRIEGRKAFIFICTHFCTQLNLTVSDPIDCFW